MIISLKNGMPPTLESADDFARFHCEIHAPDASLETARQALLGLAELESRDIAWVDVAALIRLATSGPNQVVESWTESARAMVAKAEPYGWVRRDPLAIKSHVVWNP